MPPVSCRACNGSRGFYNRRRQWVECRACKGRGINSDLWETHCRNCYATIVYKYGQQEPTYCKSCRSVEKVKNCQQWGCQNTIRYKLGWSDVPSYCGHCKKMRESGATARYCKAESFGSTCGKLIWVPRGKDYTKCRECSERERMAREAQWKKKPCKNCNTEIRYHVDWEKIPELCPSCKQKEKDKWHEKPCAGGCGSTIKYSTEWEHPPNFCKSCKEKRNQSRHESNQSENKRFYAACYQAGLTRSEIDRFSEEEFHQIPDRERLSFDVIKKMAEDWKGGSGGGFRRSDR